MKALSLLILIFSSLHLPLYADDNASDGREILLGKLLPNILESSHYTNRKMDQETSELAFDLFLKRLDYRKQFFIQEDVTKLEQYKKFLSTQFKTGKLSTMKMANNMLTNRITEAKKYTQEILSKPLNYEEEIVFETDPDKRSWAKNSKDLKVLWEGLLKYSVITEILNLEKTEETEAELEKGKEKKKASKSFAQLEIEARKNVQTEYDTFFKRMENQKYIDLLSHFVNSLTGVYDPHTNYLAPSAKEDFDINMKGKLEGIGAVLSQDGPYTKVERVVPGSPSWKQKDLKPGDIILRVAQGNDEPESIVGMDLRDAVRLIRGPKGSTVKLTVRKPDNSTQIVPIVRDVVELEEGYAQGKIIEHADLKEKIGYLVLPSFYRDFNPKSGEEAKNCTDDVIAILKEFNKAKVDGVIFDLRNNGGGSLEDARRIAGLFFKSGPVVQVKNSQGEIGVLSTDEKEVLYDGPLVILQNSLSASASEILSAALKDRNRAVVVGGEHTHGKGTVQTLIPLDNSGSNLLLSTLFDLGSSTPNPLGALKLTVQMFYRINGASTQKRGVDPDIVLPDVLDAVDTGEKHLDYVLTWDEVKPLKYEKYNPPYSIETLKKNSNKRIEKHSIFNKIAANKNYLLETSKNTSRNLKLSVYRKEQAARQAKVDEFKYEDVNEKIVFDPKLNNVKNVADKERFEEFQKKIQKDPYVEESLFIMSDILVAYNKKLGKR